MLKIDDTGSLKVTMIANSNLYGFLISSEFATSILPTFTPKSEASDGDTDICPSEEIKEEIERIRKRLEELSAKTETCRGRWRER